eukprot:10416158-Prorocentrum_lima.AAC.1
MSVNLPGLQLADCQELLLELSLGLLELLEPEAECALELEWAEAAAAAEAGATDGAAPEEEGC